MTSVAAEIRTWKLPLLLEPFFISPNAVICGCNSTVYRSHEPYFITYVNAKFSLQQKWAGL